MTNQINKNPRCNKVVINLVPEIRDRIGVVLWPLEIGSSPDLWRLRSLRVCSRRCDWIQTHSSNATVLGQSSLPFPPVPAAHSNSTSGDGTAERHIARRTRRAQTADPDWTSRDTRTDRLTDAATSSAASGQRDRAGQTCMDLPRYTLPVPFAFYQFQPVGSTLLDAVLACGWRVLEVCTTAQLPGTTPGPRGCDLLNRPMQIWHCPLLSSRWKMLHHRPSQVQLRNNQLKPD